MARSHSTTVSSAIRRSGTAPSKAPAGSTMLTSKACWRSTASSTIHGTPIRLHSKHMLNTSENSSLERGNRILSMSSSPRKTPGGSKANTTLVKHGLHRPARARLHHLATPSRRCRNLSPLKTRSMSHPRNTMTRSSPNR